MNGVSAQITAEEGRALYTRTVIWTLLLKSLMKYSPKRNAAFDRIKNELSTQDRASDFGGSIKKILRHQVDCSWRVGRQHP